MATNDPKELALVFFDACNDPNNECNPSSWPWTSMAPEFTANIVGAGELSLEGWLAHHRQNRAEHPDLIFRALSADASMQGRGNCKVFMDFEMTGKFDQVSVQEVCTFSFKLGKDGQWRCTEFIAIRGLGELQHE